MPTKLKVKLFFVILIVILFITCFKLMDKFSAKRPVINFEETKYDFGTVSVNLKEEKTVSHRFYFHNTGNRPLYINDIKTDCTCTVVEVPKHSFESGERGYLEAILKLGAIGEQGGKILVYTNASENPYILMLKGRLDPQISISVSPVKLFFENMSLENTTSQILTVNVFTKDKKVPKIKSIESKLKFTDCTLTGISTTPYRNHLGYYRTSINIKVLPVLEKIGKYEDEIVINFHQDFVKSQRIPVSIKVVPDLEIKPDKGLFVFKEKQSKIPPRVLLLCLAKQKTIFSLRLDSCPKWLDVEIVYLKSKKQYKIILKLRSEYITQTSFDGHVVLIAQLNKQEKKILRIPVLVRII